MSSNDCEREVLHQMIMLKERMQWVYRHLGDVVENPEADGRLRVRAMKDQVRLAVSLFELGVDIAYAARKLGYGVARTSTEQFPEAIRTRGRQL